ncbi:glycosyltransferase [Anditalea andensis]|uniref:Glycosyltransferase subfamily 4-like N-terminal domain-containing protein n=1 Tax=Anditalea andensis TaxID=1048983 RepID=A0A074L0S3_9BACT|nr:glycosyltransferase [Anditalea andensis]KEO73458.1 hypothetical protein EL17_11155 [Anditalea andensis]
MKRVLIISYSKIDTDPRVLRQIDFFEDQGYDIFLCGIAYEGDLPFFQLTKPKQLLFRVLKLGIMVFKLNKIRVREFLHHTDLDKLLKINPTFDLIVANDAETWPLAAEFKKNEPDIKLVFDAHEQYAKQFSDLRSWKWFHKGYANYLCSEFIPVADSFLTVCDGIAQDYEKEYNVKPQVVLNTPEYEPELTPSQVGETIELIHHGIANRSRQIEKIIHMMDYLDDRFRLNLMLMPVDQIYYEELQKLSEGKNILFLEPVVTTEISKFINQFDIGLFLLEPVNFNYTYALPNKFFEFIQARLAIAIGPSIEMKKIVLKEKIGIVSQTFDELDLANRINNLSREDIIVLKQNVHHIAQKYSNDKNIDIFKGILSRVLK